MPVVNGTLLDFQVTASPEVHPQIILKPSGAGVSGDVLHFPREIVITPDSDGTWSTTLTATEDLNPLVWYEPSIRWLEPGYPAIDFPGWKLFVPLLGGPFDFAQIVEAPSNPTQIWVGPTPPTNPTPGTRWINTTTGEISRWA